MAQIVELGDTRTWFERRGEGDPLLLLHPGGVDSRAFGPNVDALNERFEIFMPERRGHGHTADVDGPLTFDAMADDTVAFIDTVVERPVRALGYSDGAIVALLTALARPDLVSRLAFVAGVYHHEGWLPQAIDPTNEPPRFLRDAYGEVSPDGIDHYDIVARKLAQEHLVAPALDAADLARVECPTLVMLGDDDEVRLEHALAMYRALPDGELAVTPRTSHGLLAEKPHVCNRILLDFLAAEPIETLAPIRRAAPN